MSCQYKDHGKAVREPSTGKGRFDLVTPFGWMRLAKWYELGAHKYSDRNWEKGMPFSRYIDSALRHIVKWIMGMTDEDHLSAAVWNLLCIIHHEELGQTELDDMPHYFNKKDTLESNDLINQMRSLYRQPPIFSVLTTLLLVNLTERQGSDMKNKLHALLLIACTLPIMFLEGDATATVFVSMIAVPMFFAKENWIY